MFRSAPRRTVISAADHRFYRTLCQLLMSAERHGAHAPYAWIVIDLGLTDGDRDHLARRFPWCRLHPFPFDDYPPHVRTLPYCAWKPVAIDAVLSRDGGCVLWLDSATMLRAPLDDVFAWIEEDGVLSLVGQSLVPRWCHDATLRLMRVPDEDRRRRCRPAGVLGFDAARPFVGALVARWRDFSLMPECIDPPGAGRANHRYDQAILTNLLYASAREDGLTLREDEIDISSTRPASWMWSRTVVAPWLPLALDPCVRAYYGVVKWADRLVLRLGAGTFLRDSALGAEDLLQRVLDRAQARRALRRARRYFRGRASLAGRSCHCPTDLPVHLLHSEGLREACDVVIDYGSNVEHPERPQVPLSLIAARAREIQAGDVVHVRTDHVDTFVRDILPTVTGPIVLVTGESDASPVKRFEYLLDDERIQHWFAQNCDVAYEHPRLTRLPIGVDNPVYTKMEKRLGFLIAMLLGRIPFDASVSRNGMGDQPLLTAIMARARPIRDKPTRALCTFHRNSVLVANADRIPARREAAEQLAGQPDCHFIERRLGQAEYWRLHDEFAFEVSPRGNGLDCFRTWECLLLNTIPIVHTSALDALYAREDYPVVIVESFQEISTENLKRWKAEREGRFGPDLVRRLTTDHWVRRIRAAARSGHDAMQGRVDAPAGI